MPLNTELIALKAGCVGVPTPRVQARLIDDTGVKTSAGAPGELQLRGENVFRGYWGLDEEYRASKTPDGWFRTGDVATRDNDGYFRIVDRKKDMFISGGENIYPAEVEAVACRCAAVAECAVVGVPDDRWGEVGYLFVAGKPNTKPDLQAILELLAERLARYKIPKHATLIDKLPRNAAGKVLKSSLRSDGINRLKQASN